MGMIETNHRTSQTAEEHELRSVAQLRMLHALATRLNALDDVGAIGEAITSELRTLIDYHNCRVYLLQDDGVTLRPVIFRGELSEYASETYEELVTRVGEGVTGHAALTGETYYTADAARDDIGVQIPGTPVIDESVLAVPMKVGDRVTGVIVLSNLGIDQFDDEDSRVLEVLASHAAVAYENARLLQKEREAASTASALLGLSQALTGVRDVSTVFERVVAAVPAILPCSAVAAYLRDPEDGSFGLLHQRGVQPERALRVSSVPAEVAAAFLTSMDEPFLLTRETMEQAPPEYWLTGEPTEVLIAPVRWDPDAFGVIVVFAPTTAAGTHEREMSLARGISDIASLALGSARRVSELERFHELVDTLDAIFWEADPSTLEFTFLSRRAATALGWGDRLPDRWGDHVLPQDRASALDPLRSAISRPGTVLDLEYRAIAQDGRTRWLRDNIRVGLDALGRPVVRGLVVDITERKRAEQALRRS